MEEPTDEPLEEPDPADEPSEEPVEQPTDEPVGENLDEPSEEPEFAEEPQEEPVEVPTDDAVAEPVEEPSDEPVEEPEPVDEAVEESAEEPTDELVEDPVGEPAEESLEAESTQQVPAEDDMDEATATASQAQADSSRDEEYGSDGQDGQEADQGPHEDDSDMGTLSENRLDESVEGDADGQVEDGMDGDGSQDPEPEEPWAGGEEIEDSDGSLQRLAKESQDMAKVLSSPMPDDPLSVCSPSKIISLYNVAREEAPDIFNACTNLVVVRVCCLLPTLVLFVLGSVWGHELWTKLSAGHMQPAVQRYVLSNVPFLPQPTQPSAQAGTPAPPFSQQSSLSNLPLCP